jgi:hypothetical protein
MLERLGLVIHWIGFACLMLFLGVAFFGIITGEVSINVEALLHIRSTVELVSKNSKNVEAALASLPFLLSVAAFHRSSFRNIPLPRKTERKRYYQ